VFFVPDSTIDWKICHSSSEVFFFPPSPHPRGSAEYSDKAATAGGARALLYALRFSFLFFFSLLVHGLVERGDDLKEKREASDLEQSLRLKDPFSSAGGKKRSWLLPSGAFLPSPLLHLEIPSELEVEIDRKTRRTTPSLPLLQFKIPSLPLSLPCAHAASTKRK